MSDKGLTFRISKEHLKFNNKTSDLTLKWAKDPNRHFSKEQMQMDK